MMARAQDRCGRLLGINLLRRMNLEDAAGPGAHPPMAKATWLARNRVEANFETARRRAAPALARPVAVPKRLSSRAGAAAAPGDGAHDAPRAAQACAPARGDCILPWNYGTA